MYVNTFCTFNAKNALFIIILYAYIKQIMTGLEGIKIGRSICPERFRIASPRVSIDRGEGEDHSLFVLLTIMLLKGKKLLF